MENIKHELWIKYKTEVHTILDHFYKYNNYQMNYRDQIYRQIGKELNNEWRYEYGYEVEEKYHNIQEELVENE